MASARFVGRVKRFLVSGLLCLEGDCPRSLLGNAIDCHCDNPRCHCERSEAISSLSAPQGSGSCRRTASRAARFAVEAPQNRLYAPRSVWAPVRRHPSKELTRHYIESSLSLITASRFSIDMASLKSE